MITRTIQGIESNRIINTLELSKLTKKQLIKYAKDKGIILNNVSSKLLIIEQIKTKLSGK